MALEMRAGCEKCGHDLPHEGEAYICSYECSFCADCTQSTEAICPNCGGELLRRPKRQVKEAT